MNLEEKIIKEEKKIEKELKKNIFSKPWFHSVFGIFIICALLGGFAFWRFITDKIEVENAYIEAPIINLSPNTPGVLEETYVKIGQKIPAYAPVAKVGNEIITSRVAGMISYVSSQEGQFFNAGSTAVSMLNTSEERVVGRVDEDKGLADIKIGDAVIFTVDAFGSKRYEGIVDEIAETSRDSDIVFNISDQREEKQFDVKVKFDLEKYPELKNGMSAKLTIYK